MRSTAKTPEEYLAEMPPDRAAAISEVRQVILKNLPRGYIEQMYWGMLAYCVEGKQYSSTGNPLLYVALASQKQYMVVFLASGCTIDGTDGNGFRRRYRATGKTIRRGPRGACAFENWTTSRSEHS